jgi:peroxiredoxin
MTPFWIGSTPFRKPLSRRGLFCLAVLITLCLANGSDAVRASGRLIGRVAPGFARRSLHGETVDLSGYRGKVVLLNFWATWCGPCRAELPRFDRWQAKYQARGLQVLAISMDDDPALARGVVDKLGLHFPVVMGDSQLGSLYGGVFGLPVTYLIDRNGVVRRRIEGEAKSDVLEKEIVALLSEPNR